MSIGITQPIIVPLQILVNYGLSMSCAPDWYRSLWVHHCRVDRGMSDQDIREWAGRQYSMHGRHVDLDGQMAKLNVVVAAT